MSEPYKDGHTLHTNIRVLRKTNQLKYLHTMLRNKNSSRNEFIFASDRLVRILIEEGLNQLPMIEQEVLTPTGNVYFGVKPQGKIMAALVLRAAYSGEKPFRETCRGIRIGNILIQRNDETAEPKLYYAKLPQDSDKRTCLLFDPMLATGGTACTAIKVLLDNGIPENKIIFLNVIAAPEGINRIKSEYPDVCVLTTEVDSCLNDLNYILPGCGDYGDRYFGTY